MLAAVEAYFLRALKPAFGQGTRVTAGPSSGPAGDGASLVEIVASRLTLLAGPDAAPAPRGPGVHVHVHRFPADGATRDFALPEDAADAVFEVESPPGRPARRGDDYLVEGRSIRFYVPPARGEPAVLARVRGARARGYELTQPCRVDLTIRVWARERGPADELSRTAVAAALIAAVDLGTLDGSDPASPSVSLRLLRAAAAFTALVRTVETVGGRSFHRADVELILHGELEQAVALGAPEPEGVIREVRRP